VTQVNGDSEVRMNPGDAVGVLPTEDSGVVTRQHWKWSALAGMASYLDAGSIVALGSGLALFQTYLGLSSSAVGALAAIGPNALGCALGAIVGGRMGDKLGRKRIYKYDLLVYAAGILLIMLAVNAPMLFAGTFVVGVAVGVDVPTSLALVGEFAPSTARGKLVGFTQIAWNSGPVVVLLLAFALSSLNLLGIRIVFGMLFVVAIVTWALRRGLAESVRWQTASAAPVTQRVRALFRGRNVRALVWTTTIYLFWNLAAGTSGIFTPYIIRTLHAGSQGASVALSCAGFVIGIVFTVPFMRLVDRGHTVRRAMWGAGAVMQVLAYAAYLVFPFTIPVIIANIVLFAVGAAFAGEAVYKIFSQELFPTMLRATAQGFTFGAARTILGIWSFFVPLLAGAGIGPVAVFLTIALVISGVTGFFFMPNTAGKPLEQIEAERAAA
jgi:inositol transporter-like SP family MFS transporter